MNIVNLSYPTLNISATNASLPAWITHKKWLDLWSVLMVIFCVTGGVANSILFAAVISTKKLRVGSGTLIAHSILVDALICIVVFPLLTASTIMPQYKTPGHGFCGLVMFMFYSTLWAVHWASVVISVNRFVAIYLPHHYNKMTSAPRLLTGLALAWLMAVGCVCVFFSSKIAILKSSKPWGACGAIPVDPAIYGFINSLCTTVPCVFLGLIYTIMFSMMGVKHFLQRRRLVFTELEKNPQNQRAQAIMEKRMKTARMMFVSYLWFTACFMPAPITSSVDQVAYSSSPLISLFFRFLILCGCATNPIIYLTMNGEYRKAVRRILWHFVGIVRPSMATRLSIISDGNGNGKIELTRNNFID